MVIILALLFHVTDMRYAVSSIVYVIKM